MSRMLPRLAVLVIAVIPGGAAAQLSPWSSIPAASPQTVQLEQTLAVVTQGNTVNAFSALTKTWASITTAFGSPAITLPNEHLIVRDGPLFFGYSPRRAWFQAQFAFSPTAFIVPQASPQTWHSIIVDGNYLHVFFAFSGQWMTYVFPVTPVVTSAMNGRFCFLVSDGTSLYAVSSYYGTLVPCPVPSATSAGAFGNLGIATSAGMVHGFSAARNNWTSMAVAGTPTVSSGNVQTALVALNDGAAISLFSGNTGTFATLPAAPGATVHLDRYVAVVVDGTTAHAYSALLGTFATLTGATAPSVIKQQMYALLDDGVNLVAYSAPKGAFATPIATAGLGLQHRAQIAVLTPTGGTVPIAAYSSYRNEWVGGPPAASGTTHLTAVSAVVEETGGGLYGWSHRTNTWNHQPAPVMEVVVPGTSPPSLAETFFSRAGTTVYAYNPRTDAWRTASTAAPASLVRAHHATILAQDGGSLYGFSLWDDQWTTQPLLAPYSNGGGQVQAAWATDGVRVYAYGGIGQLSVLTEFPDFYRAATRGGLFRIDVAGEPASPFIVAFSFAPASIPVPPYGTLLIDPSMLGILAQASAPGNGVFSLTLQIPDDPALSGVTPYLQTGITGPSGLYLTNSVFPTIY